MVRVLAVRRYELIPLSTARELVRGKNTMSKRKSPARKPLEVTIMFEPSRLAATYLANAYAQVAPLEHGSIPVDTRESPLTRLNEATASGREQA